MGVLTIRGPYIVTEQSGGSIQRWYPAPLDLREAKNKENWKPSSPDTDPVARTDLGSMVFISAGTQPTGMWISEEGLRIYLENKPVPSGHLVAASHFYVDEPRVGLARDSATRAAEEGMLYSVSLIRLKDGSGGGHRAGIAVRVNGVPEEIQRRCEGMHRFGGEGRVAWVEIHDEHVPPATTESKQSSGRLVLITPGRFNGSWLPPQIVESDGNWKSSLNGLEIAIVSAVMDKPVRIGGWDMVKNRPKPAEACVPAGSVYFVRTANGASLDNLHDKAFGSRSRAGFGHMLLGQR
jgi:CRISPR-associated protein Cmr3